MRRICGEVKPQLKERSHRVLVHLPVDVGRDSHCNCTCWRLRAIVTACMQARPAPEGLAGPTTTNSPRML